MAGAAAGAPGTSRERPPARRTPRQALGDRGGPPAAHKAGRSLGGPPRAAGGEAPASRPPHPFPPPSPLPSRPGHRAEPPRLPPLTTRAAQRGANEPPAPALTEPPVADPTPTDRCAPGTSKERPGIRRGPLPRTARQQLQGFRFPQTEAAPA